MLKPWIYQKSDWPNFIWESETLINLLAEVRSMQGKILGKMQSLGFELQNQAVLETITLDVIKSTEIEGEILNPEQVRSSVAKRLGINTPGVNYKDRNVEGIVEMMLDATQNFNEPLTKDRLFDWHAALFPTGRSGMHKIIVGDYRNDSTGPMQVISGPLGKEKVHFEAIPSKDLSKEISEFLVWFNSETSIDPVLKTAIAHLWFVTIHPFEDGNGRIARAITDMLLARADGIPKRFYSMSKEIMKNRKEYYDILERTQQGALDITKWISWFLTCLREALASSEITLNKVLVKHKFWLKYNGVINNERQYKMLNILLDDTLEGVLSSSKWAKMNKCSADTAGRDIKDLIEKEILIKSDARGRSTSYELARIDY